jgi:hypothetical protein
MPEGDSSRGRMPMELVFLFGIIVVGLLALAAKVAGLF